MHDESSSDNDSSNGYDSDVRLHSVHHFVNPDTMMMTGLQNFCSKRQIRRWQQEKRKRKFQRKFGVSPVVAVLIWEDLQTTSFPEAHVEGNRLNIRYFLMALHHLKKYPTDEDREDAWDVSMKTGREWTWYYCEKIQALKSQKITWPSHSEFSDDIWVVTVDGTHCWIHEPIHPEWSQDKDYFSHKYAKAGMSYELAISISESKLVWMNGPFKAGASDARIFTNHGLQALLRTIGKKAIGDKGYNGYPKEVSTFNAHDGRPVKKFKSRALKRHENFNNMTKRFKCLDGRFRHSPDRFKVCFEAVCVICQYQMENGMPLYDILIEDVLRE
jgi:DDE superfamily endonuclease